MKSSHDSHLVQTSIFAVFAFAVALLVVSQGVNAPFAGEQEPLQAQWIQDIVSHGHWLLARDYYGLINLKPPLYFWLSALLVHCAGRQVVTEPLSRLVSVIAGAAVATEVSLWTRINIGRFAGWLAFGLLLGWYGFVSFATVNIVDMLMACLLFSSYSLIYPLIGNPGLASRAALAGVTLGLAILTKGPVAVLLWALAVFLFVILRGNKPIAALRWWWIWESIFIAIVIATPWYVAAATQYGDEFTKVVIAENLGHALAVASTIGTGPAQKWSFIPLRLFRAALPSVFLLGPLTMATVLGGIRPEARKPLAFHLAMVIGVVVFFSVAHSVQSYYVLPALPSLAIVISGVCAIGSERGERRDQLAITIRNTILTTIPVIMLILLLSSWWYCRMDQTLSALSLRPNSEDWRLAHLYCQAAVNLPPQFLLLVVGTCAGALLSTGGLILGRDLLTASGMLISAIVVVSFWASTMRTALYETLTTKSFAASATLRAPDARVYTTAQNYQLSFYSGFAPPIFGQYRPFDMFGRGKLPSDVFQSALDDKSVRLYMVLREHDRLFSSAGQQTRLSPIVCAAPGVFRRPCLFLIIREPSGGIASSRAPVSKAHNQ